MVKNASVSDTEIQDVGDKPSETRLPGVNDSAIIFINSPGCPPDCVLPLARVFNNQGFECDIVSLSPLLKDLPALVTGLRSYWDNQIKSAYDNLQANGKKLIYLCGFSFGATLAFDFASRFRISGIIAISTLFPFSEVLKASGSRQKEIKCRQHIAGQMQRKKNLNHFFGGSLSRNVIDIILSESFRIRKTQLRISCPIALFHSLDDRIANYGSMADALKHFDLGHYRIVNFRGVDHFLQFNVSPVLIRDLALRILTEKDVLPLDGEDNMTSILKIYEQAHLELKEWGTKLFNLLVGFFSLFGVLLYESIGEAIKNSLQAGYLILAYSFVINIYLLMSCLYFFYLNRTMAYLKQHIEPQCRNFSVIGFNTNRWAAGSESLEMTREIANALGFPCWVLSLLLTIYGFTFYFHPSQLLSFKYILLSAFALFNLISIGYIGKCYLKSRRFTKRELYLAVIPGRTTSDFENALFEMYSNMRQ